MPLFKNNWHGGILDSGNNTLDILFNHTYNPNNIHANNTGFPLYWFVDFARTEHPMSFQNLSPLLQPTENQTLLAQVQSVYPSLLGLYSYNNYWEWVWQPVGITQYMHYPEYWGILEFVSTDYNQQLYTPCWNIEWPGRFIIYSLWWSNYQYFLLNNGTYTFDVDTLVNDKYCLSGYCNYADLKQAIFNQTSAFQAQIFFDSDIGCINMLPQYQQNLQMRLYGGPCYHISLQVFIDNSSFYTVNITESHYVSVDKPSNISFCLNQFNLTNSY
ncbi:hypothetical protein RFI_30962 [Reticulomyxa filosa]|uniref:Uncharacterized protein n=1 Tax=Reticulomyxa filosa TaxID=46433 RepID=X6M0E7_RETFI|nr:hypothetical protein RFI_30962 [Reticulomyxa filosa]|eukprot:ETO06430.1 hypothetical protein RFI_30962 [Reticulomyxa filosa]